MGHRSERMLLQVYTHLDAEDTREAIEALPSLGVAGNVRKSVLGGVERDANTPGCWPRLAEGS